MSFYKILFIFTSCILFLVSSGSLFAADTPSGDIENSYATNGANFCEGAGLSDSEKKTSRPWLDPDYSFIIKTAKPEYFSPIDTNIVNQSLAAESAKNPEFDPQKIGNYRGFKALEIARLQYRNKMNQTFACAIINSRLNILVDLRKKVENQYAQPYTEIKKKLETEVKKLDVNRVKQSCADNLDKATPETINTQLLNTTTYEYCWYSQYLIYLREKVEKDNAGLMEQEKDLGKGSGTLIATNSKQYTQTVQSYQSDLDRELNRAKLTLPRALSAYREMKRTYALHIMLVIIYDDYLTLRDKLSTYFNASTQLLMKSDNSQTKK